MTAISLYPRTNNIAVGDNKGIIRIFNLINESASLISTFKLHRDFSINQIYITHNEQVAVITFSSGHISLYDIKNSFTLIGDATDKDFSRFNTQ